MRLTMKFSKENEIMSANECLLIPKECRNTKDLVIGSFGSISKGLLEMTKKEYRKRKKREKENMWKRNNRRNCCSPVVVRLPIIDTTSSRSALQAVHKSSGKAREHCYYQGGLNHDWVDYYEKNISSDQSCINEWNAMANLESRRPPSPDSLTNKEETELLIRSKLKEIMMSVDIDEVTSKYIRQRLEEDLAMDLFKYKSFIDQEMLIILGQMDAATEIFPHVYLGSEWNASNLEELKLNRVGFILNVTKEIDNFFPGMFDYLNIRVYDDEKTELLRHWDDTYKYISLVREKGSKVLVHCKMGISRSASVVIAYAMKAYNLSFDEATDLVRKKRSCIKPNQAFTTQLKIYQGILDASRQRHNALFRSKSETNLKTSSFILINRSTQRSFHTTTPAVDDTTKDTNSSNENHTLTIPEFKRKTGSVITANGDTTCISLGSNDLCHLSVPSSVLLQRPKSWSPDEETANYLSLNNYEEPEYGEGIQKCHSLNDQIWHAHVKIEQRDLRDPGEGLIEAFNPYLVPSTVPSSPSTQQVGELQLSSSVKERINEFESVQCAKVVKSPTSTLIVSKRQPDTIFIANTNDCSSTDDVEKVEYNLSLENLYSPSFEIDNATNLSDDAPMNHLANRDSPEIVLKEDVTSIGKEQHTVSAKETIIWPTGIVKRQTEDFEEKVRNSDSMSIRLSSRTKDSEGSLPSLSRQASSHSLGFADETTFKGQSEMENWRKDDPFSVRVDSVFDKEETKEKKGTLIKEFCDAPSRNNSWGSFDSAVILLDREAPSRQSSWGSCDTRLSAGSIPSRNSSFGAFDGKTSWLAPKDYLIQSNSSNPVSYFDSDNTSRISPSTIRKNKINAKLGSPFALGEQENLQLRNSAMVKAFGPAPYKCLTDKEPRSSENCDFAAVYFVSTNPPVVSQIYSEPTRFKADIAVADNIPSWPPLNNTCIDARYQEMVAFDLVKKTKQKLENNEELMQEFAENEDHGSLYSTSAPSIGRSLSSGCMSTFANNECKINPIMRSASEKRAKSITHSPSWSVKKIMSSREKPILGSCDTVFEGVLNRGPNDYFGRSHSLERLGDASSKVNNRLSAFPRLQTCDRSESQTFLDRLVVETQAQVHQLEKDQEEIKVKNLVDMFEEGTSQAYNKNIGSISTPSLQKNIIVLRKMRPRSESMSDKELPPIPPVPLRKSSLDHSYRIVVPSSPNRRSSTNVESLRHSISPNSTNASTPSFHFPSETNMRASPSPPKPPPPPPNNRTCSIEVRRRKKQQGKTHPLSKLTPRENPL